MVDLNHIIGTALIRSNAPGKIEYKEIEESSYTFNELFYHEFIGRTARGDKSLLGCCFSFSYENIDENPPPQIGERRGIAPTQRSHLQEDVEMIRNRYQGYLSGYSVCEICQLNKDLATSPAKILLWSHVMDTAELREDILIALECFGVPCDELRQIHQELRNYEKIDVGTLSLLTNEYSNILSALSQKGTQSLFAFEAELEKAKARLKACGVSLRFLFFAPKAEYQKIRDIQKFLPLQIQSILCISSIGHGHKPDLQNIHDKELEKSKSMDYMYFSKMRDTLIRSFEQHYKLRGPEAAQDIQKFWDRYIETINEYYERIEEQTKENPQGGADPAQDEKDIGGRS